MAPDTRQEQLKYIPTQVVYVIGITRCKLICQYLEDHYFLMRSAFSSKFWKIISLSCIHQKGLIVITKNKSSAVCVLC